MSQPSNVPAPAGTLEPKHTDPANGADTTWPEEANVLPSEDLQEQ